MFIWADEHIYVHLENQHVAVDYQEHESAIQEVNIIETITVDNNYLTQHNYSIDVVITHSHVP